MDLKLKNKTVLVTAASTGIGRATAELFLEEGANVAICSSNINKLEKTTKEIYNKYGKEVFYIKCDINDLAEIENTVKIIEEKFGEINILVNNCGGPKPGFFENMNEADWANGYDQVLMSAVRFTKLVLPKMKENKWGRIINITSISVKQPIDNLLLSNAFRSAVTAFAKTISNQLGDFNITINNVAPGYTLTARLEHLAEIKSKEFQSTKEEVLKKMADDVPLKRLGKPEELASLVVYLASKQAAYITGQTIVVDGGFIKSTY